MTATDSCPGRHRFAARRNADARWNDVNFSDLEEAALRLNDLYEELEVKRWGRVWTTQELALGFVGDVGDLAKLIQAHAGVRDIDDCTAKPGHELSDCLWSVLVLANKCGIDLQAEFSRVRTGRSAGRGAGNEARTSARPDRAPTIRAARADPRCGPLGSSALEAAMREIGFTVLLLTLSNVFMTFAWYAHLKELGSKPWVVAALVSWGIAFFEYLLQVPANRIGYGVLSLGQLKILQEVITLSVFVPFAVYYMKEPLKLDYLWAGLCILGAVYFIFRGEMAGS